jgi:hypothetical protein
MDRLRRTHKVKKNTRRVKCKLQGNKSPEKWLSWISDYNCWAATTSGRLTTISMPHELRSAGSLASRAHRFHRSPVETTAEFRARNASGSRQKIKNATRAHTAMTCNIGNSFWMTVFGFASALGWGTAPVPRLMPGFTPRLDMSATSGSSGTAL